MQALKSKIKFSDHLPTLIGFHRIVLDIEWISSILISLISDMIETDTTL